MVQILSLLKELVDGFSYEQWDTTNMSELEGEKSAEQERQWLKIQAPNQMLSILLISLAQLKARNNSENFKMKPDNYCTHCTDQKNWLKIFTTILSTLFKNGNNLCEHRE